MHDNNPIEMIAGVPVLAAPIEIDTAVAEQLRAVLLEAASRGHTTVVVDMTGTLFCDSSGLSVLIRAHKRALEEGGELRLVIPPGGAVSRIFTLTSLYRFIPRFASLGEALLQSPAAPVVPSGPGRSSEFASAARPLDGVDGEVSAGG